MTKGGGVKLQKNELEQSMMNKLNARTISSLTNHEDSSPRLDACSSVNTRRSNPCLDSSPERSFDTMLEVQRLQPYLAGVLP